MKRTFFAVLVLFGLMSAIVTTSAVSASELRPTSYPLVVHDPYFSIWSPTDELADSYPVHWTGATNALVSFVKIDGQNYRLMGTYAQDVPKMKQTSVEVRATQTIYTFEAAGVALTLKFTSPILMDDLMVYARPATYLTWTAKATDGKKHDVRIYYDNSAELCVNTIDQEVKAERLNTKLDVLRMGTAAQPVLGRKGDRVRIDWGYVYLAVDKKYSAVTAIASDKAAREGFLNDGKLPVQDDTNFPRQAQKDWPVLACVFDLAVEAASEKDAQLILAYDDEYAMTFLGEKLRPYWRKDGQDVLQMLEAANREMPDLMKRCDAFDAKLTADATKAGGSKYAELCAMTYRESCGAHKLAQLPNGKLILVSKENSSNGCAATVDILYPTSPIFMVYSSELLKATLTPAMEYCKSGRWPWKFAPHDVGTFPLVDGQVYGGGEKTEENQMPVEESGNMLIVLDMVARIDGNTDYANEYWDIIAGWAEYLLAKGLDPENQLCTDDFAGHLAHNVNLSAKAIVALACFADLCERHGDADLAKKFRAKAEEFAQKWMEMAKNGDHYRLAFDQADTWSMKYNLVWDKLMDLKLFPKEVVETELKYYKTKTNAYGLPLDNRSDYTKLDWEVWTATMASDQAGFDAVMNPIYKFINTTEQRVPLTDWYYTSTAKQQVFQARAVVGAVFIKMLDK